MFLLADNIVFLYYQSVKIVNIFTLICINDKFLLFFLLLQVMLLTEADYF